MASGVSEGGEAKARYNFKDKTIIITGGGGNIGRAVALRFAKEGANVAIFDLQICADRLQQIVEEINNEGGKGFAVICDVTSNDDVISSVQKTLKKFSKIDFLFNNAGYQGLFMQTENYPIDDFKKVMEINVIGVFNILTEVSKQMKERGKGGAIVNTASEAGVSSPPNMIAYATSKAAVIHMTKIAGKDLAPFNIRVNSISPAFIGPGNLLAFSLYYYYYYYYYYW